MVFPAPNPLPSHAAAAPQRTSLPACRVHNCARCTGPIESGEPCSFVRVLISVCPACTSQQNVLKHLPGSRVWGLGLARSRRI